MRNIIIDTDTYKLGGHWNMIVDEVDGIFSYGEARTGAKFPYSVFFGLQPILKNGFEGRRVSPYFVGEAANLAENHLGKITALNIEGWHYIIDKHDGFLPLRICAVPEGTPVPVSNVLMTVEATDSKCRWLTSYVESVLTHSWYGSAVATLSRVIKEDIKWFFDKSVDLVNGEYPTLPFALHDFGFRSAANVEQADTGGAAHLINFMGTDTPSALPFIRDYYQGDPYFKGIGYSVPATEHLNMTILGPEGEVRIVGELLKKYPTGILSVVADSFDYYNFVENIVCGIYKEEILKRDGVFVIRPDSCTPRHKTPAELVRWTLETLARHFGCIRNKKDYYVINPKVRVLYGDGLNREKINDIHKTVTDAYFSSENIAALGMGGGLIQSGVNRDTQRNAFKCSAARINGEWKDVQKNPLDQTKKSKAGRLKLIKENGIYKTVRTSEHGDDLLVPVFENGKILRKYSFDEVRQNAKL
jgi:nicotinamide phosphoribosyltransferase